MKTFFASKVRRSASFVLLLAFALFLTGSARAETKTATVLVGKKKAAAFGVIGATGGARSSGTPQAISLLDEAYGLLRAADHDYHGHRAHAMHAIEAAARELGSKVGGNGKGHEKQADSDTQLRDAQGLLGQAVGGVTGKAHHHVQVAINQLTTALKIK
jgi:hypothetical protein